MELTKQSILALLLMRKGKFANAYDLCRALSRIFGLINCSEIISLIIKEKYVTVEKIEYGVEYFSLTIFGQMALDKMYEEFVIELKNQYVEEHKFIDSL
jgi:hypothetical protein